MQVSKIALPSACDVERLRDNRNVLECMIEVEREDRKGECVK